MKVLVGVGSFVLTGVLALPVGAGFALERASFPSAGSGTELISRGGGRGGGSRRGGGGGGNRGGGHGGGGHARAKTGFRGGGGLNRGDSRPSGGWSNNARSGGARPSMDRPSVGSRDISRPNAGSRDLNRPNAGTRNLSRPNAGTRDLNVGANRNINRDFNRNINRNVNVNRNWNRRVNINNVNVRPGWARPGWGVARPWNHGWYGGWTTPAWGWWGARAAAWGVGTLATAAIINDAVNNAVDNNTTYIVVPNSNYQLVFGSVQPSGTSAISFAVTDRGSTYELTADCQSGLLDGQEPQSAAEAELLNAACQVAFGNA